VAFFGQCGFASLAADCQLIYETHNMPEMAGQTLVRYILNCPLRTLRLRLLLSFVIGYLSAGFVHVTVFSSGFHSFTQRIATGVAASFMGAVLLGTPCCESGNSINLWPCIALTTAVVVFTWMIVGYLLGAADRRIDRAG
jgi:hypothetical protein